MITKLCRGLVILGCVVVGLLYWFTSKQLVGLGLINLAGIFYIIDAIEKEKK